MHHELPMTGSTFYHHWRYYRCYADVTNVDQWQTSNDNTINIITLTTVGRQSPTGTTIKSQPLKNRGVNWLHFAIQVYLGLSDKSAQMSEIKNAR